MAKKVIDIDQLLGQLCTEQHQKCIDSLLAGNDTGCFTIQQYAERYHNLHHKDTDRQYHEGWVKFLADVSPRHLRRLGCTEVKPGVWTSIK